MTSTASAALVPAASPPARRNSFAVLTLGAIGVVYGDIGTSPLYTIKEVFAPATGVTLAAPHIIGAVSAIVWALMLVVTLKYVILILRADNHGEGGGLALTALAVTSVAEHPRWRTALLLLGAFGATLFYGDSIITPAISVLGAIEGLEVITPALRSYVMPLSVGVLGGLFLLQRLGTAAVGRWFGPIITLWFAMLAVIGAVHIAREPGILAALDPRQAWSFLAARGVHLLASVGAIVLALTGAEALYADMGHFGRKPIQWAWSGLVLPALALNYMGQGALLMRTPAAIENPFYRMFPSSWLLPALVLATLAAIIASQAVISGAYSMTRQAVQLGLLPRMAVHFTSAHAAGQIYMPAVNWALLAGVTAVTLAFGSSSALAGAYGMAVTLTMMITTVLTYFVVRRSWRLSAPVAIGATLFFFATDALLVAGCAVKFTDGGWVTLALGLVIFVVMVAWWRGRALLAASIGRSGLDLQAFVDSADTQSLPRVARTGIYPVAQPSTVPQALLHNLKHYRVLHQCNVILTVVFREQPFVAPDGCVNVQSLGHGFWQVTLYFGFMDTPDVPNALRLAEAQGLRIALFESSYFLSRETVAVTTGRGLAHVHERLFAAISRNAAGVVEYFHLPDNAVVELGTRVQLR